MDYLVGCLKVLLRHSVYCLAGIFHKCADRGVTCTLNTKCRRKQNLFWGVKRGWLRISVINLNLTVSQNRLFYQVKPIHYNFLSLKSSIGLYSLHLPDYFLSPFPPRLSTVGGRSFSHVPSTIWSSLSFTNWLFHYPISRDICSPWPMLPFLIE